MDMTDIRRVEERPETDDRATTIAVATANNLASIAFSLRVVSTTLHQMAPQVTVLMNVLRARL